MARRKKTKATADGALDAPTSDEAVEKQKGRPLKVDGSRVPYEELDRLLVFGEQVPCDEDGEKTTAHFPSMRELARRYEVSVSLISKYAHQHNCLRRREEAQARIHAKVDQQLIEYRANAIARSLEDELRTIDRFLAGFEGAVAEGRVRVDNPSDYNQMVRLREFLMGGADSRQEVHTSVSLEELQARHRQMLRAVAEVSAADRARLGLPSAAGQDDGDDGGADSPPAAGIDDPAQEVNTGASVSTCGDDAITFAPGGPGPRGCAASCGTACGPAGAWEDDDEPPEEDGP